MRAALLAVFALGCVGGQSTDVAAPEKALDATRDHHWIYDGPLPPLEDWRIRFSLRGHTVRVSGVLPDGWRRPLPDYVVERFAADGRREVTVFYPASTAGEGARNADPGGYPKLASWSWTPSNIAGRGVAWGGFPYLEFDPTRAIAFHGPITAEGDAWRLQRGPVSHGCARMQGEHIVELAHLVGLDMGGPNDETLTFGASDAGSLVEVVEDYDRFEGWVVDVDYPAEGFERPTRPEVKVFPTWSSDALPRFVCAHDPSRALGQGHCGAHPAGTRSPVRWTNLGATDCPPPYHFEAVGTDGGLVCTDGVDAIGPHTREMVDRCLAWGGGDACLAPVWSVRLTRSARGTGVCPAGAALDYHDTAYCLEGDEALGPFPPALVTTCERIGAPDCDADRWPRDRLITVLERSL